ncbi:MAG: hypothetical protein EBX46_01525 [Burkholderiaceae bacterium]|nr:hypothetical protein [Burkholderiaceae bacterium]
MAHDLVFHLLDLQSHDMRIESEQDDVRECTYESHSDEDEPVRKRKKVTGFQPRELVIHLFGAMEDGTPVRCDVTGFQPTLYLRLPEEKTGAAVDSIKQYINHMYDANWKRQQDEWIMRDGLMQLFYSGIPFLVIAGDLWNTGNIRQAIPWVVDDRYLTMDWQETPEYAIYKWPFEGTDPGYHGSPIGQEYLAEIYAEKIRNWQYAS